MTRDEMIDRLVDDVDGWDMEALLDHAKESIREGLENLTDEDLADYYSAQGYGDNDVEIWNDPDDWDEPSKEELACNCGKTADKGQKCWWCGAQN